MRPRWGTETASQWSGFFFISQDLLCRPYQALCFIGNGIEIHDFSLFWGILSPTHQACLTTDHRQIMSRADVYRVSHSSYIDTILNYQFANFGRILLLFMHMGVFLACVPVHHSQAWGPQIPWNWSQRWSKVTLWMLEIEIQSFARAAQFSQLLNHLSSLLSSLVN